MNRIKETRLNKNVSQKKLAKVLNTTQQAVSLYESGKREPKLEIWKKLADYFKVSVPYIQGLTYTTDELIKIVHDGYFFNYYRKEIIDGIEIGHVQLIRRINTYITLTSDDVTPDKLYDPTEKLFKLTENIKKYWLRHLKKIITKDEFKDIPRDAITAPVMNKILWYMGQEIEALEDVNEFKTPLGSFFVYEYDGEEGIHDKVMDDIKAADYQTAKESINQYFELIKMLKSRVDNFDADKYFNSLVKEDVYDNESYKDNKYIDEMLKRVKNGDTKLRDYLIVNWGQDLVYLYRTYKTKIHEDTEEIDDFLNNHRHN
ncbi:helix-turn-helix transcriptional regulator [Lactobacillus panisapium]|uniref:helix-turn-helix transcriptional regulator n=1 Tax=Lactobacillus panisapium TaxID=2012495 RepID=UPI001C6A06EC|nr:helix-turn-helix transcriptional regulator [Lactobacillus panisapium]QYN54537.1 helix-turn-helix transcriptional regulator [Lactobacillus panisapium]